MMKKRVVLLIAAMVLGVWAISCDSDNDEKGSGCNEDGKSSCAATHSTCVSACNPLGGGYETCVNDCDIALCDCLQDSGCMCERTDCEPACGEGFYCVDGTCQEEVTSDCDPACGEGFTCMQGTCIPDGAPDCDPACEEGFSCVEGNCVEDATGDCDPACEEGFSCVDGDCVEDATGTCEPGTEGACADDYTTCITACDPLDGGYTQCVEDCDVALCDCLTAGNCSCEE